MKPLDHIQVLTLALHLPGPVAVAQLRELGAHLGLTTCNRVELQRTFRTRTAQEWENWGTAWSLPLAAVREMPPVLESQP